VHSLQKKGFWEQHPRTILFAGIVGLTWLLGIYVPAMNA
jgi:hypothetical protein